MRQNERNKLRGRGSPRTSALFSVWFISKRTCTLVKACQAKIMHNELMRRREILSYQEQNSNPRAKTSTYMPGMGKPLNCDNRVTVVALCWTYFAAAAVRRRRIQLQPSSDDDVDDSSAWGAVLTSFPSTILADVVVTCWEGRRMGGRQETPVWWLRICTVLRVRSGRMETSFGWDR
jgi:hypothetical protein